MDGEEHTPKKVVSNNVCLICGCEESNSRKKTSLHGKVTDLRRRICDLLDIPLCSIENGFICNDSCYRDVKRLEKFRENAKNLLLCIKEKFWSSNRLKRGVPSDASISPSVAAPSKTLRRERIVKMLTFDKNNQLEPADIAPAFNTQLPAVMPLLPIHFPLAEDQENTLSDTQCDGNICKVQVSVMYSKIKLLTSHSSF